MMSTLPLYWFDATASDLEILEKVSEDAVDSSKGRKIRCCYCQHIVTYEDQRVSIAGSFTHDRVNPSGLHFHFECFQRAPGCSGVGTTTDEYTWFAGYRWQVAICAGCGEHLGWIFKGSNIFYGLISSRLLRDEES